MTQELTKEQLAEIKTEALAHVKEVSGNKACYDSYTAAATKYLLQSKGERERIKELEDGLRGLVNDWIGEAPFQDEPVYKTHNDAIIGEMGYWTPAGKIVKAELISKAKQLLTNK